MFGETAAIRVNKFNQTLHENYSKSTKIAITACEFSKIFRGNMPPDPLELSCFSISFKFVLSKKITFEKNVEIMPPLLKFLATPLVTVSGSDSIGLEFSSSLSLSDEW